MPYQNINEINVRVRNVLPIPAQRIFMREYNNAAKSYTLQRNRMRIAWRAIKNAGYIKDQKTGKWKKPRKKS